VLVPDFDLFNFFGQSQFGDLWIMLIGFVLLIFPLNELIFKPIFHSLDARAEKINGARKRSGELQAQADDVLERYETAIREARSDSEQARQAGLLRAREEQATLTSEARGQAERELETARAELGESLEEARASLRASAESLAEAAAAQVLGRALS
jgi:F-type H+-transporting ATPase subunit b